MNAISRVKSLEELLPVVEQLKKEGKTIVTTNGCFDILHVGHARNLADAKALGDILIVGVNSDASVRENKGPTRPIVSERERAEMIALLASVDYVFIFNEKTPLSWIRQLKPSIHVKGGGEDIRTHPDFPEMDRVVQEGGGTVVLVPHHDGRSTSDIVRRIKEL